MATKSCCTAPQQPTKTEFLAAKLRNFRAFLEPHCGTDQLREAVKVYDSVEKVMPYLLQAVAATKAGQGPQVLQAFCEPFGAAGEDPAFRAKVQRYLDMFVAVLTT